MSAIADIKTLWPVYEFRPLPELIRSDMLRYAEGKWLPDDGEFDLAFIVPSDWMFYYVDVPYQKNILWSWLTTPWWADNYDHPQTNFNPWHYMLRDGAKDWGGYWGRESHKNKLAGDNASRTLANMRGCANGASVDFNIGSKYISSGLLRVRETGEVVKEPERPKCMYCAYKWLAKKSTPQEG